MRVVCLLSLLWSLVEVHSQTFPYVSFNGQTLVNHSYVDLSLVGTSGMTVFGIILTSAHVVVLFKVLIVEIGISQMELDCYSLKMAVSMRNVYNHGTSPTGIYRCDISTNAVHDDTDLSVRDTVYVGLYTGGGGKCFCFRTYDG